MLSDTMMLGLQEEAFRYPLEAGEMFQAPEVILSYSSEGMNRLSQNLHHCISHPVRCYRHHVFQTSRHP